MKFVVTHLFVPVFRLTGEWPHYCTARIIHEHLTSVASGALAGGEGFQDRREPIRGGFAKTSLFLTILKALPTDQRTSDTLSCS
ncbi:MAG: hypothetical protein WD795_16085 [Woeseia sp.]